jgi:hypothetical protein
MKEYSTTPFDRRRWLLAHAADDFFFLQNRGYPRRPALDWVGNRYRLTDMERQLLHRGVFSQGQALARRSRRCRGASLRSQCLAVDGHNVLITVESSLLDRPLLKANDGAVRDIAGLSAGFGLSETTQMALDMIFRFICLFRPGKVLFFFDAPMSRSGQLAGICRERLRGAGIRGEARAVPVPEREFPYSECIVASSDQAVLDAAACWIDLASGAAGASGHVAVCADFSSLLLTNAPGEAPPHGEFLGQPPATIPPD